MRHQMSGRVLGSSPAHKLAILRNLSTSLLNHQRINTTTVRAKELRRFVEPLITLGKNGSLAARRSVLKHVKDKFAVQQLFGEFADRYKNRSGGYTRIIPLGNRRGDSAPMVTMVLVGAPNDPFAGQGGRGSKRPSRQSRQRAIEASIAPQSEQKADELAVNESPIDSPAEETSTEKSSE